MKKMLLFIVCVMISGLSFAGNDDADKDAIEKVILQPMSMACKTKETLPRPKKVFTRDSIYLE